MPRVPARFRTADLLVDKIYGELFAAVIRKSAMIKHEDGDDVD